MASSYSDQITVLIIGDESDHRRIYNFPGDTTIVEILDSWIDDLDVYGHWCLTSVDGCKEYEDMQTIKSIEETVPGSKLITLKIKRFYPFREYARFFVVDDNQSEENFVHVDQKLGSCVKSPGVYQYVNQLASLYPSVTDINIPDNGVIYKTCVLSVLLSDGCIESIRIAESAIVQDLKNRLTEFEHGSFFLKYMGRVLHPQEPIRGLLLPRKCIEVYRPTVTVRLSNKLVQFSMSAENMRYGDLLSKLLDEGALQREDLENISFRCRGCGRRIWADQEHCQKIFSDCCSVQSLDLEEDERCIESADTSHQYETDLPRCNSLYAGCLSCGHRVWADEEGIQKILSHHCPFKPLDREELLRRKSEAQERSTMDVECQYEQTEEQEFAPIFIHGYDSRSILYAKQDVPVPLTTNQLRNEIHRLWGWSPENVWLYRRNGYGRVDGLKCVHVCGDSDDWQWGKKAEYCDTAGFLLGHQDVAREWSSNCETLLENASVPLMGTRRNIIAAELRANPLAQLSIYVQNKLRHGKDFIVDMRNEFSSIYISHLKLGIAEQMKMDPINFGLFWRKGMVSGKICIHVCDKDGVFIDGHRRNAVYMTDGGEFFYREKLESLQLIRLHSSLSPEPPMNIIFGNVNKRRFVLVVDVDKKDDGGTSLIHKGGHTI